MDRSVLSKSITAMKQLNSLNKGTESNETIAIPQLKSLIPLEKSFHAKPDYKFYLAYDFYKRNDIHFFRPPNYDIDNIRKFQLTPQLNNISLALMSMPLLSARNQIDAAMFCNESTVKDCDRTYCHCLYVLQVKLNSLVEIIMVDKGYAYDANHPFHVHGHNFRVLGLRRLGNSVDLERVIEMDNAGKLNRNFENPPIKDTVTVPDGGYTIFRFKASNPGYWLYHCHLDHHTEVGMGLVFKVGENKDIPPVPENFPTCGDYLPNSRKQYVQAQKIP